MGGNHVRITAALSSEFFPPPAATIRTARTHGCQSLAVDMTSFISGASQRPIRGRDRDDLRRRQATCHVLGDLPLSITGKTRLDAPKQRSRDRRLDSGVIEASLRVLSQAYRRRCSLTTKESSESSLVAARLMGTERGGFEPPDEVSPVTRFPVAPVQPLRHLSICSRERCQRSPTLGGR